MRHSYSSIGFGVKSIKYTRRRKHNPLVSLVRLALPPRAAKAQTLRSPAHAHKGWELGAEPKSLRVRGGRVARPDAVHDNLEANVVDSSAETSRLLLLGII